MNTTGWDLRSLPKIEAFSGKDDGWNDWSFTIRSYANVVGAGSSLRECEVLGDPPEESDMSDNAALKQQSAVLYHLLVQLVKGKAKVVAKNRPRK